MPVLKMFAKIAPATEPNERRVFAISVYYSLVHLGLMTHAFFTGHLAPPNAMIVIHTIFVGLLYAVPKEYDRWKNGGAARPPRPGHVLVVLWFLVFVGMSVIQYLSREAYKLPDGMTEMTTVLLGTLSATSFSKLMYGKRYPCPEMEASEGSKTETGA
jgi:hypothetical protein